MEEHMHLMVGEIGQILVSYIALSIGIIWLYNTLTKEYPSLWVRNNFQLFGNIMGAMLFILVAIALPVKEIVFKYTEKEILKSDITFLLALLIPTLLIFGLKVFFRCGENEK